MSTESLVSGSSARMFRALVNHSRNGEFCSSCANRSINSRRSCGVSASTSLIILLSASVDIVFLPYPQFTTLTMNVESDVTSKSKDRPTSYVAVVLNDIRQQLVLNCCNLGLDHAAEVQLTAPSEGQVFGCVSDCFRMLGVFNRRH